MSLEILRDVARDNAAAHERDQRRSEDLAASNPAPVPSDTREGIPLDMWRALPSLPG